MAIAFYTRTLDAGSCVQTVTAVDGVITRQTLRARAGQYSGNGNPELVGQSVTALRGKGFAKLRGTAERDALIGLGT